MTDIAVDRIRLRGAGTARLARVAARALPGALDRALRDLGDADVGTIAVSLDPAVLTLDDDAIAVIWADAVRAALVAEGVPTGRVDLRGDRRERPSPGSGSRRKTGEPSAQARLRTWLRRAAPRGPVPASALSLATGAPDETGARTTKGRETDDVRRRLRRALREELALRQPHRLRDAMRAAEASAPPPFGGDSTGLRSTIPGADAAISPEGAPAPAPGADPATHDGADALIAALADLVAGTAPEGDVDLDRLTRAAGLALLYPWLADHGRAAADAFPREDPAALRVVALAALVDPADPSLLDDALIRHLAGLHPGDPAVHPPGCDLAEVTDAAAGIVRSFAALLPGFEQSSPAFVRREWLSRPGLLDTDRDPALLLAHARPLDVVLGALPYPLGLFALPWCRPVAVRFRP